MIFSLGIHIQNNYIIILNDITIIYFILYIKEDIKFIEILE